MEKFEWDDNKNKINQERHSVSFLEAQYAFADPLRVIAKDQEHSETEERLFCIGKVDKGVMTVRFTYRNNVIRIIGAGFWRKGRALYEQENKIQ